MKDLAQSISGETQIPISDFDALSLCASIISITSFPLRMHSLMNVNRWLSKRWIGRGSSNPSTSQKYLWCCSHAVTSSVVLLPLFVLHLLTGLHVVMNLVFCSCCLSPSKTTSPSPLRVTASRCLGPSTIDTSLQQKAKCELLCFSTVNREPTSRAPVGAFYPLGLAQYFIWCEITHLITIFEYHIMLLN